MKSEIRFELIREIGMNNAYLGICILDSVNMKAVPYFAPAVSPLLHGSIKRVRLHFKRLRGVLGVVASKRRLDFPSTMTPVRSQVILQPIINSGILKSAVLMIKIVVHALCIIHGYLNF